MPNWNFAIFGRWRVRECRFESHQRVIFRTKYVVVVIIIVVVEGRKGIWMMMMRGEGGGLLK